MPLGIVGAVALGTAVAGIGVGVYEANQAHGISSSYLDMAHTVFNEQQYYEQQLQQLIADPSSVTKLPGYAFNLSQGAEATARTMASGGFGNSGTEAAALTQYGQNYAMSTYNQQVQILSQLAGITSASSPAQSGAVAAASQGNQAAQLNNLLAGVSTLAGRYSSAGGPPPSTTPPPADSGGGGSGGVGGVGPFGAPQ